MKSQNAIATIGNITSCAGEDVLVPFDVVNFNNVGAMTFYIAYDTNAAEYISIQNINLSVPGFISSNALNGQINIAYSNTNPFFISGEKLFDLKFHFLGDSTSLSFNPGSEIADINLEIIPLETNPGSIQNSIQLINQPDSVQSYPDNDVTFRVTSLGNPDYQWQENTGSGWLNLQNNSIYSGVTNDTLTIYDVPLSFNGFTYRCILTAGSCTEISEVALLEVAMAFPVATLGNVSSCPEFQVMEPLFVGDFIDVTEFTFNISFDQAYLTFLSLENIHADLLPGTLTTSPLADPPGLVVHWEHTSPVTVISGKLFDLKFEYESMDHTLAFEEGTLVLNSFSNPINITLNNGVINQHDVPLILIQPENDTVLEEANASFSVIASGANEYLWQVSTDGGGSWTNLTNTVPYYNINTATLTISPAAFSMNEYQFACRLDNNYCTVYSLAAILHVDTLTFISDPDRNSTIRVYPVPFQDNLQVSLPVNYFCSGINIYDIRGTLLKSFYLNQTSAEEEINLDLSPLSVGVYFLKVSGKHGDKTIVEQKIILKTN